MGRPICFPYQYRLRNQQWQHLNLVSNNNTFALYLNGLQIPGALHSTVNYNALLTGSPLITTDPPIRNWLGYTQEGNYGYPYAGRMDEFRVEANTAITQAEAMARYNNGCGGGTYTNLVVDLRLDNACFSGFPGCPTIPTANPIPGATYIVWEDSTMNGFHAFAENEQALTYLLAANSVAATYPAPEVPVICQLDTLSELLVFGTNRGDKRYELTNHLGNVMAVVSDKKLPVADIGQEDTVNYWLADVLTSKDYYPYGMHMPGRGVGEDYRYTFNTQEPVLELDPKGDHLTAPYWEYDAKGVHRWNTDPETDKMPSQSPYSTFGLNPVIYSDLDGLIPWYQVLKGINNATAFVTSWFNEDRSKSGPHSAIDITSTRGTPVRALARGQIARVGYEPGGYGNFVVIKHKKGYYSLYAHLESIDVKVGDNVGNGASIGGLGNTGHSTGPHLHLEIIESPDEGPFDGNFFTQDRKVDFAQKDGNHKIEDLDRFLHPENYEAELRGMRNKVVDQVIRTERAFQLANSYRNKAGAEKEYDFWNSKFQERFQESVEMIKHYNESVPEGKRIPIPQQY